MRNRGKILVETLANSIIDPSLQWPSEGVYPMLAPYDLTEYPLNVFITVDDLADVLPDRLRRDPFTGGSLRCSSDEDRFLVWTPHLHGDPACPRPDDRSLVLVPPPAPPA